MRILVAFPEHQLHELNRIAKLSGRPRAEIIRSALETYVKDSAEPISAFFGLWKDNSDLSDVEAYLDALREEWQR